MSKSKTPFWESVGGWAFVLWVMLEGIAFGLSAGALGTYGLLVLLTGGLTRDGWGAAPAWLLLMLIGSVLSSLVFVVIAYNWCVVNSDRRYHLYEWIALAAGIALTVVVIPVMASRFFFFAQLIWMLFAGPIVGNVLSLLTRQFLRQVSQK